jgi:hypothetical protein
MTESAKPSEPTVSAFYAMCFDGGAMDKRGHVLPFSRATLRFEDEAHRDAWLAWQSGPDMTEIRARGLVEAERRRGRPR